MFGQQKRPNEAPEREIAVSFERGFFFGVFTGFRRDLVCGGGPLTLNHYDILWHSGHLNNDGILNAVSG